MTSLYHYYYDVIKGGQYVFVIEEMHKKYGSHLDLIYYKFLFQLLIYAQVQSSESDRMYST